MAQRGEIYFIDEPKLGTSTYGHFALLVTIVESENKAYVNFIATDSWGHDDLRIDSSDANFTFTGLKHTSHLLRDQVYSVSTAYLTPNRLRGKLSGEMRKRVSEWWGEPI